MDGNRLGTGVPKAAANASRSLEVVGCGGVRTPNDVAQRGDVYRYFSSARIPTRSHYQIVFTSYWAI